MLLLGLVNLRLLYKSSERRIDVVIDLVEKFKRYLKEDEKSLKTIESYVETLVALYPTFKTWE